MSFVTWLSKTTGYDFSFNTTAIAVLQDNIVKTLKEQPILSTPIYAEYLKKLKKNVWFILAKTLSPGNLTIRQMCLIDILSEEPANYKEIWRQMRRLATEEGFDHVVWAEGYSYWLYTKTILDLWLEEYGIYSKMTPAVAEILRLRGKVDAGFKATAYRRGDKFYPAPFGDLADIPISEGFNNPDRTISTNAFTLTIKDSGRTLLYTVKSNPVGLNVHTPVKETTITVVGGIPGVFKFYQGYDKKYASKWQEIKDILNIKRILNI